MSHSADGRSENVGGAQSILEEKVLLQYLAKSGGELSLRGL